MGPMEVPYDMNQMVNDLMEMKEIAKELRKIEGSGRDYVLIDDWKSGRHLVATPPKTMGDDELADMLRRELPKRGLTDYEIRRYRYIEELAIVNAFACGEMIVSSH